MQTFSTVTASYMALPIKDIDTDMIIPAQFLTSVSKEGFGQNLFRRLRDEDPSFPLNDPINKDAKIIVADSNFGCGSSREHAVWAILGAGFSVVIAKSFSDIFFGNAMKNGLLLVTLPVAVIDELLAAAKNTEAQPPEPIVVDLHSQTVTISDSKEKISKTVGFQFDPFRKHCFLNGQDDFDYLLAQKPFIDQYWKEQEASR